MVILLNPFAGGGKAIQKWKKMELSIRERFRPVKVIFLDKNLMMADCIMYLLQKGNQHFVAAGGDGTVNLMLNSLMRHATPSQLSVIKIGAIGLGSSNDFHKPMDKQNIIEGIHCLMNFSSAVKRDIGELTFCDERGLIQKKYWIINASIGITAEANLFFNTPDFIGLYLKKSITSMAILYAALRTIASYKNQILSVRIGTDLLQTINLTNMGITKSPHFSGNFSYDTPFEKDSGKFYINISRDMQIIKTLHLLWHLSNRRFRGLSNTESFCSDLVKIESSDPFAVEYDGEVVTTNNAVFDVKQKMIRVCSC